ncbi:MAG: hypothetical protein FJX62_04105 [Alphaproteobacteria bacterium]|nr:hypothetical protein [Alphaproteobacteria bacterium]
MRSLAAKLLLYTGLFGGLLAAATLAHFIWSLDWGTGRRSGLIGGISLVLFPALLWAAIFFFFAWLVSLLEKEP